MGETERILAEYRRREAEIPAHRYAPTEPAQLFMRQRRERAVLRLLGETGALPLADSSILEVGCGTGQWLVDFESWGANRANLAGIDLIEDRINAARHRLSASDGKGADLRCGDASSLPWDDDSFELVLQSMMFSSISDPQMTQAAASEMRRVLTPGGIIVWHDFVIGNPANRRVRGIGRRELASLFPGFTARVRRTGLAFPLARRLAPRSWLAAEVLEGLRVLNVQVVATLRSADSARPAAARQNPTP